MYDVRRDDAPLRKVAGIPGEFDKLRKNYLERREWSSLYVICDDASAASLLCNWVLTPFIIRHVNLFFMLSAVTLAGSFAISGVNHHV